MSGPRKKWRILMLLVIFSGLLTLGAGLIIPMMTVKKLILVQNTFSVLSGIGALLADKTFGLGVILLAFSVLFPIAKLLGMAAYIFYYPSIPNALVHWQKWLGKLAKFSMLDVFVVALMLMILKLGVLVEVEIHAGIYWFTVSVVISMIAGILIENDIEARL
ncbi:paraquat-inducible protein A [Cardiobacteriaceae bacterium TAE3-ERU3]|nr:paraquat-inducible protein A [Cardiobacteriaceae bacterium TAE3-ERU3]